MTQGSGNILTKEGGKEEEEEQEEEEEEVVEAEAKGEGKEERKYASFVRKAKQFE